MSKYTWDEFEELSKEKQIRILKSDIEILKKDDEQLNKIIQEHRDGTLIRSTERIAFCHLAQQISIHPQLEELKKKLSTLEKT